MGARHRRKTRRRPPAHWRAPELSVARILNWADAWYASSGAWPKYSFGLILGSLGEKWINVDRALRRGNRGLAGGSSLARLLAAERGVRNKQALPPFKIRQLLTWIDAHHRRTGCWPRMGDGPIAEAPGETWTAVDTALRAGIRGLRGGSSLAQLLAERRGVRNEKRLARFVVARILDWADRHQRRTGSWPTQYSGPIVDAPGETWSAVHMALSQGHRGLPGGSSLAQVLARYRQVRNEKRLPRYRLDQIVAWAQAHRRRTGQWPSRTSGNIADAPGETWVAVESALRNGRRGLPGGSSLAQLLADRCGKRNVGALPRYRRSQIIVWARAYRRRTGQWPTRNSGPIPESPAESWNKVEIALYLGRRGLSGGSSLAQLLARRGP